MHAPFRCRLTTLSCHYIFRWLLYLSVYVLGGTFFSFQWDILLLEAGFLAIFTPAPLPWSRKLLLPTGASPPFQWLTRFLLFKLVGHCELFVAWGRFRDRRGV